MNILKLIDSFGGRHCFEKFGREPGPPANPANAGATCEREAPDSDQSPRGKWTLLEVLSGFAWFG